MKHLLILAAAVLFGASLAAYAQTSPHGGHGSHGGATDAAGASTQEFRQANDRMHADMSIAFTGDADVDFVRGMIPHHQGAIDMAKVQLKYGKEERIRKLASDIIEAQEREIAEMKEWLKKRGY